MTTMTPLVETHPPLLVHLGGAPEPVVPEVGARAEGLPQEGEGEHADWAVIFWSTHSFTLGTRDGHILGVGFGLLVDTPSDDHDHGTEIRDEPVALLEEGRDIGHGGDLGRFDGRLGAGLVLEGGQE